MACKGTRAAEKTFYCNLRRRVEEDERREEKIPKESKVETIHSYVSALIKANPFFSLATAH